MTAEVTGSLLPLLTAVHFGSEKALVMEEEELLSIPMAVIHLKEQSAF